MLDSASSAATIAARSTSASWPRTSAPDATGGNQTRAAQRLGLSRRALIYKLEKYGLKAAPKK